MRKLLWVLLSATLVLSVDALGATPGSTSTTVKVKKTKKCLFPKSKKRAPSWVCDAQADGMAATAVGSAAKSGAGISHMEQMAAADARSRLVQNVRESVQKDNAGGKDAANKNMAASDSALTTNDTLQGAKIIKKIYGPKGRLFVLVGLDETNAQKLRESIAANYPEQKHK